jgi:2-polyprenyl-6-hydroxyphenyl methylase/3-demethylubiquinone-9 3-methyltransferase
MSSLRPSDALWKEGAGYYIETPQELRSRPLLPDPARLRDRRILDLFDRHANLAPGSRVLEIGCGRSRWLPFLASRRSCVVFGLDIEPHASDLARANLAGAGATGRILCRDAFRLMDNRDLLGRFDLVYSMGVLEHFDDAAERVATLSRYLRPGGRILTTVPNMRGVNWLLQRLGSRETLEMHVVYDSARLTAVHEAAGLTTIAAGCAGFFDGYLTSSAGASHAARARLHARLCRAAGLLAEMWLRAGRGALTPEIPWCAPHVFYVGRLGRSPHEPAS